MNRVRLDIVAYVVGAIVAAAYTWSMFYALAMVVITRQVALLDRFTNGFDVLLPIEQAYYYWGNTIVLKCAKLASLGLIVAALVIVAVVLNWRANAKPKGGARFASPTDLRKAGLLNGKPGYSIVLGTINGKTLRYSGDSHVYLNGPTRAGKGVSFILLNGQEWRGSLICLDPKHENFEKVGPARRAMGQRVFMFDPANERSHRWNPLDFVRGWPSRATDLQNIATHQIPPPESGDAHWADTARALYACCLAYVKESRYFEGRRTIRSVVRLFSTGVDLAEVMSAILKDEPELHQFVKDGFNQHIAADKKQRVSFEKHITTSLSAWSNALIAEATSASDFDIRQLRQKPITIFIGSSAGDLKTVEPVIRLFLQQVHDVLLRKLPGNDERAKVLLLLDEFYQFGKVPEIVDAAPLIAGYGFKAVFVLQNVPQMDQRYGKSTRDMILGNCDLKIFVGIGDKTTADLVSDSLGRHFVEREGWGTSQGTGWRQNKSRQGRWELVPLVMAEEVQVLPANKTIVLMRGHPSVIVDKIYSFNDRKWQKVNKETSHLAAVLTVPELNIVPEGEVFASSAKVGEDGSAPIERHGFEPSARQSLEGIEDPTVSAAAGETLGLAALSEIGGTDHQSGVQAKSVELDADEDIIALPPFAAPIVQTAGQIEDFATRAENAGDASRADILRGLKKSVLQEASKLEESPDDLRAYFAGLVSEISA